MKCIKDRRIERNRIHTIKTQTIQNEKKLKNFSIEFHDIYFVYLFLHSILAFIASYAYLAGSTFSHETPEISNDEIIIYRITYILDLDTTSVLMENDCKFDGRSSAC